MDGVVVSDDACTSVAPPRRWPHKQGTGAVYAGVLRRFAGAHHAGIHRRYLPHAVDVVSVFVYRCIISAISERFFKKKYSVYDIRVLRKLARVARR